MSKVVDLTEFQYIQRSPKEVLSGIAKHPDLPHRMLLLPEVNIVPVALNLTRNNLDPLTPFNEQQERELLTDAYAVERFRTLEASDNYRAPLLALYFAGTHLQEIFPNACRAGVRRGVHSMVTSLTYALTEHIANEKRSLVQLSLNGSKERGLPLELKEDEPLQLIQILYNAMMRLHEITRPPKSLATAINKGPHFQSYRLWDEEGGAFVNPASVYIRPYGSVTYDPAVEYGRPGEGVEASISYVIDPEFDFQKLIPVGKHSNRNVQDNRISIRLDREGVAPNRRGRPGITRDPTQESGTISLDIGSVIGEQEWLGTKIGRLLAWGNVLRSEALGSAPLLNHAPQFFDPLCGQRDIFAAGAREIIEYLETHKLDIEHLTEHLSAGRVESSLHEEE